MEFMYRHQRCRETLRVKPTPENLKRIHRKLEEVKIRIQFGDFDYCKEFPESKQAFKLSDNKAALMTIEHMVNSWYDQSHKSWKDSTERSNRGRIKNHIIPNFGKLTVEEFKPSIFRKWQKIAPIAPKTVNEVHTLLSQAFDFLLYDDIIDQNPMKRVKRLPTKYKEVQPFDMREREKILTTLPEGYARDFYDFAFWTGLRTGEQIALRWKNVDLKKGYIYIRESVVKGKLAGTKTDSSNRNHELCAQALRVLKRIKSYKSDSEYVFLDPRTMQRWKNDGLNRH